MEPTVFNTECSWVDYPDDFDRIEFAKEFHDGEFHVSDVYVVNHDTDNVIKFVPRAPGVVKILLQQPEADEIHGGVDTNFDLEIGLYDPEAQKFLKSDMNRHLEVRNQQFKLEYSSLSFEITEDLESKPLYIFFRALNFTDNGAGTVKEGCLSLYLEAEFRKSPGECKNHFPFE